MNSSTTSPAFHIWDGVFESFRSAPSVGDGFSGAVYYDRAIAAADEALAAIRAAKPIRQFLKQRSTVLPPIVASTLSTKSSLSILDFGGGLGIGFLTLLESIPNISQRITYEIVEVPRICEAGRRLFRDYPQISFTDSLPASRKFDIVYSSSALQYVEDWQSVVRQLGEYGAPTLLLSDVFAGNIPTFCSLQTYYDSKMPQWFWNLDSFLKVFSSIGYTNVMKLSVAAKRLDRDDVLPMENFDTSFRLAETVHLLFVK